VSKLDEIQKRADAAIGPLCGTEGQPMNWPGKSGGCRTCDGRIAETLEFIEQFSRPFIVCAMCGNKRCPKATWHGNQCSGSNHTGQDEHDPVAEFIAHAREDVPLLAGIVQTTRRLHWREFHTNKPSTCHEDGKAWPCPTQKAAEVLA